MSRFLRLPLSSASSRSSTYLTYACGRDLLDFAASIKNQPITKSKIYIYGPPTAKERPHRGSKRDRCGPWKGGPPESYRAFSRLNISPRVQPIVSRSLNGSRFFQQTNIYRLSICLNMRP